MYLRGVGRLLSKWVSESVSTYLKSYYWVVVQYDRDITEPGIQIWLGFEAVEMGLRGPYLLLKDHTLIQTFFIIKWIN